VNTTGTVALGGLRGARRRDVAGGRHGDDAVAHEVGGEGAGVVAPLHGRRETG